MHHFQGISVDTGVSIDGDCSITHTVNADSVDITFGSSSGSLLLTMTENAAVKLVDLTATALGDLRQRRATAEQMTDTQNQNRERVSDEPAMVSLDAGAFVEDDCPMSYDVEINSTCITFGDTRACVNLWLSDMALLNLAAMAKSAARTMLHKRGNLTFDPTGS